MFSIIAVGSPITQRTSTKPKVRYSALWPKHIHKVIKKQVKTIDAGYFTVTAYTNSSGDTVKSPGQSGYGITASGKPTVTGKTVAADWSVLPNGTEIEIEGFSGTFTVENTGSGVHGRHIDLFVGSESTANQWGVKQRKITIVKEGGHD